MSEEEKKAIDIVENIKFKKYCVYLAKDMRDEIRFYQTEEERKAIDIVLNIIEKLQKEIEELKQELINQGIADLKELNNYIRKDKIREKLNQTHNEFSDVLLDKTLSLEEQNLNAHRYDAIRNVLEELLEE